MKKIAVVAIWFFALMTPSMFAQVAQPPFESVIVGAVNPFGTLLAPVYAQEFSLSSLALVNRVDLGLNAFPGNPSAAGSTCTFSIVITDSLSSDGSIGSLLLQQNESIVLPATEGNIAFSDTLPGTFLPAGSYYLVVDMNAGSSPCPVVVDPFTPSLRLKYNAGGTTEVGTVGEAFVIPSCCGVKVWVPEPETVFIDNHIVLKFSFDLVGPIILPPPVGGGIGQIARLVVEGPVTPPPGGPVQAQLGFLDISGNAIGPSSTATLNPGQMQSLDLNLSQFARVPGQRIEVRPVITEVPNAAGTPSSPAQLSASVQILDALTGFGTVLNRLPQPGASVPALGPQVLAGGQTMRVNVVAEPPDPCFGQVSFIDKNGNPIGSTLPVNLSPGTGTSLDLNADTLRLRLGQSIEVQPTLTLAPPLAAAALSSFCQTSVEVFDHFTGRTWTYQSSLAALPAVQ